VICGLAVRLVRIIRVLISTVPTESERFSSKTTSATGELFTASGSVSARAFPENLVCMQTLVRQLIVVVVFLSRSATVRSMREVRSLREVA